MKCGAYTPSFFSGARGCQALVKVVRWTFMWPEPSGISGVSFMPGQVSSMANGARYENAW